AAERLELEVGERAALPEPFCGSQQRGRCLCTACSERLTSLEDQLLETLEIELAGLHAQQVAGRPRHDSRLVAPHRRENPPPTGKVVAEGVVGRVHALLGEELGDQTVA